MRTPYSILLVFLLPMQLLHNSPDTTIFHKPHMLLSLILHKDNSRASQSFPLLNKDPLEQVLQATMGIQSEHFQ